MKNIKKLLIIIPILTLTTFFTSVKAEIKVVASIKPIHSLATYLMEGVAKPKLIVDGYASPHGFALKPSHAKMLQEADLIFWVGEDLESFLEKPLNTIAKKIREKRFNSGSFNFSSNEIKFRLDKEKKPIEVFKKKRKDTHKMVEEYMLLANKLVAEKIISIEKKEKKNYPFVYRIHEDPEESKISELKNYIR